MALDISTLFSRASDPSTPGDELTRVASLMLAPERVRARDPRDVAVLEALASNPNASPALLFSLAPQHAAKVASNPVLSLLLLESPSLLTHAPVVALCRLLARPELPTDWLEQGARHAHYQARAAAAASPRLAPATLALLADDAYPVVWLAVATNHATSPETLAKLARSRARNANGAKNLLRALSSNPATPLDALETLSDEVELFPTLARDTALPLSLIEALVAHESAEVRAVVAQRPDLPPRLVRRLAADADPAVRTALARHTTDQALIARLSFSADAFVLRGLIENPHTPILAIERLAHAPGFRQRQAARRRLVKQRAALEAPALAR
jgi:hypothetical protein